MPFDFELTFSGLCLFTFPGADKFKPEEVNVYLVGTPSGDHGEHACHCHIPRLSYRAKESEVFTQERRKTDLLFPTTDGDQIAVRQLEHEQLTVVADEATQRSLQVSWRKLKERGIMPPPPTALAQETDWLDWIPSLTEVDPQVPPPPHGRPEAGLCAYADVARVRLTQGRLFSKRLLREKNGHGAIWQLRSSLPGSAELRSQAIAELVKLRIEGVESFVLLRSSKGKEYDVELTDVEGTGRVAASVTNLPPTQLEPPAANFLHHFDIFFNLVDWSRREGGRPDDLHKPRAMNTEATGSSGACTGTKYP